MLFDLANLSLFFFGLQLDDWVLCRIYKKKNTTRASEEPKNDDFRTRTTLPTDDYGTNDDVKMMEFPRTSSISHLWELEYLGSISQLLNDNSSGYDNFQNTMTSNAGLVVPQKNVQSGEMAHPRIDSIKFEQNNQSSMLNQPVFGNSVFEF